MSGSRIAILLLLLAAVTGCDDQSGTLDPQGETSLARAPITPDAPQGVWLRTINAVTSRYYSPRQAFREGYVREDICVSHPDLGGMGYHWVNFAFVDPNFDPLQPEAVLYAKKPNGELTLVALEYVVIDVGQAHPEFAGHPFDVGGVPPLTDAGVDHWSLHVWLFERNAHGLHAPFNPSVSCP